MRWYATISKFSRFEQECSRFVLINWLIQFDTSPIFNEKQSASLIKQWAHVHSRTHAYLYEISFLYTKKRRIRNVNVMAVLRKHRPGIVITYSKMNTQYCYAFLIQMQHTLFLPIEITREEENNIEKKNQQQRTVAYTDIASHLIAYIGMAIANSFHERFIRGTS